MPRRVPDAAVVSSMADVGHAIVSDCDMISKIRARQSVRNDELYTRQAADQRAPAAREQEACRQKPRHAPRH